MKNIEIKTQKGEWNGYAFPIVDKYVHAIEFNRLLNLKCLSEIREKYKSVIEHKDVDPEYAIECEAEAWAEENYPNAPSDMVRTIIQNYRFNGRSGADRKLSRELLNRLPNLIVSYARHSHTDYDSCSTSSDGRSSLRLSVNGQARQVIDEWRAD